MCPLSTVHGSMRGRIKGHERKDKRSVYDGLGSRLGGLGTKDSEYVEPVERDQVNCLDG